MGADFLDIGDQCCLISRPGEHLDCRSSIEREFHLRITRLQEGKYTAGQIDARWTDAIEQDYYQWLKRNEDHLPFPRDLIEEILREHK